MPKEISKSDLYSKIAELIEKSRHSVVSYVNTTMVQTYFLIGKYIVEDEQNGAERAEYGKAVLKELSQKLTTQYGRGFSVDNLQNMRNFYKIYSPQIYETLSRISEARKISSTVLTKFEIQQTHSVEFQLSWSHYLFLMRIENSDERNFYEKEAINSSWSLRELKRQFDSSLYERLALSRDKEKVKELSEKGLVIENPQDIVKDPYILEFLGLPEQSAYSESELEQGIITRLEMFLLELGKGFTFVGRQERITYDEKHFYIDLVFYNRLLQCFVLIDLKIGEITHQDIGQMQMYVNYYDRKVRLPHENKTIGILLCKKKNDSLVEMTLPEDNAQIFASKYETVLPSKDEFKKLLNEGEE